MNKILTTKQVATILGCHYTTVRRYIITGLLKGYKLGGNGESRRHWKIREQDLKDFLQGVGPAHGRHTKKYSDCSEQVAGSAPSS